ncbi:MAG TPA: isoprenylcysteine carboxylmethyltransferase family protein [Edaphocola sp.]|nr:isoprenylcysteine carboxylmethyltransferase family protein [Edaphocola sp.]
MTLLPPLLIGMLSLWLLAEGFYAILLRPKRGDKQHTDRFTYIMLWGIVLSSVTIAILIRPVVKTTLHPKLPLVGASLFIVGILMPYVIIRALGKMFTVQVTIKENHELVQNGYYKYLRHPSYSFFLLTCLGLGLYLNNLPSLLIAFIPPFVAFLYRIKIEEALLVQNFGLVYLEYKTKTKKLIPFIY